jgi:hypothetical protein
MKYQLKPFFIFYFFELFNNQFVIKNFLGGKKSLTTPA